MHLNRKFLAMSTILLLGLIILTLVLVLNEDVKTVKYRAGVVTNGHECAQIGGEILQKGGSAVDAAIAALFCEGVGMPQSAGLGGGFFMTIYHRKTKKIDTLLAREVAPGAATKDMFDGDPSLSSKGPLSVAVPGELRGYGEAHKKYGILKWEELIRPTIDLCKKGHLVTPYLADLFASQENSNFKNPSLRSVFVDPKTGHAYKEGQFVKREKLAQTLEIIAKEGPDALNDGSLTRQFVEDIRKSGGIITEEDMKNYRPRWATPLSASLPDGDTLHTLTAPSSGVILTFIINILKDFINTKSNLDASVVTWQRIVESIKYGYGRRTEIGDPKFIHNIVNFVGDLVSEPYADSVRKKIKDNWTSSDPKHYGANFSLVEDKGTAHISVIAPNGDAVSVTSTINLFFGAGFASESTGIILNDEMDDFSSPNIKNAFGLPPSPANYIVPGKIPVSSMCPAIIVDKNGDVKLVIGAAGGTKITTATVQVLIRNIWYKTPLVEAVHKKRLHHQLFPMQIFFETDFPKKVFDGLVKIGHNYTFAGDGNGFAALTALSVEDGSVVGATDPRRSGSVYLIE